MVTVVRIGVDDKPINQIFDVTEQELGEQIPCRTSVSQC